MKEQLLKLNRSLNLPLLKINRQADLFRDSLNFLMGQLKMVVVLHPNPNNLTQAQVKVQSHQEANLEANDHQQQR